MTQTIKFTDTALSGYGFDLLRDRVVSYKRDASGQLLDLRGSYKLNYYDRTHIKLRQLAQEIARSTQQKATSFNNVVAETQALHNIKPNFPYVLYSKKNQCSQYFFANTTIGQALGMLAKRGENVAVEDIRILNVDTGVVTKVAAKRVVTEYALV